MNTTQWLEFEARLRRRESSLVLVIGMDKAMKKIGNTLRGTVREITLSAVCLGLISVVITAQAQMALPGEFSVTPNGAASYSIALQVPPGIAGLEPKLALVYNSQAGNGQLGVGWALAGLSSINRCPQTLSQDGVKGAVNFGAGDRFCLDGKRLMLQGGTYGSDGSTYRTEIESFAKVKAVGKAGVAGPDRFVVKTKDGLTMDYGSVPSAQISVTGAAATTYRTWALNKVVDKKGNYLTISYIKDSLGGYYPDTIYYTGNDATTPSVTAPAATVKFNYVTTRTDTQNWHQGGYGFVERARLDSIETTSSGTSVAVYSIAYEKSSESGRTRIKTITQCSGDGSTCRPVASINYGGTVAPLTVSKQTAPSIDLKLLNNGLPPRTYFPKNGGEWISGDFLGTGRVDLVHLSGSVSNAGIGSLKYWASNGDGGFNVKELNSPIFYPDARPADLTKEFTDNYAVSLGSGDVDGDGVANLVYMNISDYWELQRAGSIYRRRTYAYSNSVLKCSLSGLPSSPVCVNAGRLGYYQNYLWNDSPQSEVNRLTPLELTLDAPDLGTMAYADIFVPSNRDDSTGTVVSAGDVLVKASGSTLAHQFRTGDDASGNGGVWKTFDANGDGLTDILHFQDGEYYLWKSNGSAVSGKYFAITRFGSSYGGLLAGSWQTLDLNGDGLTDMVHIPASGSAVKVWISKGNGTFLVSNAANGADPLSIQSGAWQVIDYNGDGKSDMVHLADASTGKAYIWQSNGDGTFSNVVLTSTVDMNLSAGRWKAVALRGDGVVDLVHFLDDSGNYAVWNMPRGSRDVPTSIDNGLGNKISFVTQSLPQILDKDASKGGSYSRVAPTGAPASTTTIVPSIFVTTQVKADDGLGGVRTTGYNYANARVDRAGRGYLGFEWLESVDNDTNQVSRTTYSQTFPYVGMVASVTKGKSRATPSNLYSAINQYGCFAPARNTDTTLVTASSCVAPPAKGVGTARYFPYLKQVNASSWDWDGSAMPGSSTVYSGLDGYGNVTKIETSIAKTDGTASEYKKTVDLTFQNDEGAWLFGKIIRKVETAVGPDLPAVVTPGSNTALPPAPPPKLTYMPPQLLAPILSLLLSD